MKKYFTICLLHYLNRLLLVFNDHRISVNFKKLQPNETV